MAERPEDLALPVNIVQKIMQDSLPEGVVISKEARQTISRASSVFILYLTSCAIEHTTKGNRKLLTVNDIFNAVEDMEFDSFVEIIDESLKEFKYGKQKKVNPKVSSNKENIEIVNGDSADFYEDDEEDEEHQTKKRKISEGGSQSVEEIDSNNMQHEEEEESHDNN